MKKIWSLQFAQERSEGSMGAAFRYSCENDVNIIDTDSGSVPFIEHGGESLELMTKTEQCFESDDDNIMISFEVAQIA